MTGVGGKPRARGNSVATNDDPGRPPLRLRPAKVGPRSPPPAGEGPVQAARRPEMGHFQRLMDKAPVAAFAKDSGGCYVYANKHLLAMIARRKGADWRGRTDADLWPADTAAVIHTHDMRVLHRGDTRVFSRALPIGSEPHEILLVEFPLRNGISIDGVGGIGIDITEYSIGLLDRAQLAAVVDHTAESVLMADLDGRITFVNAAFERLTGYSRDEVIGRNPRLLKSGLQPPALYEKMWATITAGRQWEGEIVNRRKDGSFVTLESLISPIVGQGKITGYVSVDRDVTDERAFADYTARSASEHDLVLDVVRDMEPDATPEDKAQAICRKVASLDGVAAAQLVAFELDGRAFPIGHVVSRGPTPPSVHLSGRISRRLRARATTGPWAEPWANRQGQAYDELVEHAGPSELAYAPIRYGERLIGLLAVQSVDVTKKGISTELLPTVVEFANLAGVVLGRVVAGRIDAQAGREHVSGIITEGTFRPVFQPIVDLFRDEIVGYEALTRFTDGSDPESVFIEAAAVELGVGLESATLKAALAAAEALPESAWLNVNASTAFILAGGQLRSILSGSRRRIVVEVTEHETVVDYPAFRAAMATLGPRVSFAVDDAGAGSSSLRHILELKPAFVKLDRWLVAGLDSDEARQAMIVGLRYFSRKTGCLLIAEGIETEHEIAVLRSLDIHLGQGYALGRPAAAVDSGRDSAPMKG